MSHNFCYSSKYSLLLNFPGVMYTFQPAGLLPANRQTCNRLHKTVKNSSYHLYFYSHNHFFSFQCLKTIKNKYTLCYKTFPVSWINKKKPRTFINSIDYRRAKHWSCTVCCMVQRQSVSGKQDFKLPFISCNTH